VILRSAALGIALWAIAAQSLPTPRPPDIAAIAPAGLSQIRQEIDALIATSGAEVAVAWRPLDAKRGEEILISPTVRFHAASTMKVPVMIELFRQVHVRKLKLSDKVLVTNQFTSIQDGSPYVLAASEDSDGETYKALGKKLTYRELIEASITVSSNLATNILIEHLGARNVQATVDTMGASGMQVLRGVEDQKAFDAGKNNSTDAQGLLALFEAIAEGTAVDAKASAEMIEILKRQKFNDGIPAGLPPGTAVAHKTGFITRIHHDAGIVYTARPYVLVILTRGILDRQVSAKLMADISRVIARAAS
jgi:beta-lactamase class A